MKLYLFRMAARLFWLAAMLSATLLAAHSARAASLQIKVAVIDTGFTATVQQVPICGMIDFTNSGTIKDTDSNRHGSNVAGLIAANAEPASFCLIILKVFNGNRISQRAYTAALNYVLHTKIDFLNLSLQGRGRMAAEITLIKQIINKGTVVVAAAGNEGAVMHKGCDYYPACTDDRIVVVGNVSPRSNTGTIVDVIVDGQKKTAGGTTLSGTSQSAAIHTGRLVKESYNAK